MNGSWCTFTTFMQRMRVADFHIMGRTGLTETGAISSA